MVDWGIATDSGTPDEDFSPVERIAGREDAGVLFLCDHAANALPPAYGDLGLSADDLRRHIAWDIGAADVTRALADRFGAPAILTTYSRLLIDPNRGGDDPTLVMRISDGAIVPGNVGADAAEIERRRERYWRPYRAAVRAGVESMLAAGPPPALVSVHSFTPVWRGRARPWHMGLLWDSDPRLARNLLRELENDPGLLVGDNEPYDGALVGDTLHEHGTSRGLAHVLLELRQDLIDTGEKAARWAERVAGPLASALAGDDIHIIRHYPSRAGAAGRPQLRGPDHERR